MKAPLILAALLALAAAPATAGPSGLKVVGSIPGPDGGWDYASFDAARRTVLVAHGDKVLEINADTDAVRRAFPVGKRLHSVVAVPGANRLVVTDSGDNTAKVVDAVSGAVLAIIPAAADTDSAIYDPASGLVVVVGGDSGAITLVDPRKMAAVGAIPVGGALEYLQSDGHGRVLINAEDSHQVVVVDLAARKVLAKWPLAGCEHPTGMALVKGDRLVSACGNGVVKILSAVDGRDIATLSIGQGPDAVIYDAARNLALVPSGRSGTLAVIALSGPAANTIIDTVPTALGARTGALDPKTGRIYLPTAEYNLPPPAGKRPTTKPGTFKVLVLGR